ncbi:MAG: hypothetical protein PUC51_09755 [Ruminococcus sp.]|nr:hypothetical protein [Ruminococcus sp.]
MLDFLKKSKKEKELQAAREAERKKKEEERQKLAEQKAKIARHAEGGEKIRRALRNIDLENYEMLAEQKESKLSVETIDRYFQIVDNIESVLDDAMISDVDTVEIDQDIVQMIALFSIALESGNEKTATQLLKGIAEGVKFTRTPFIYSNEEQKEALARKRRKEINTLLLLGRCQEYIDRVQESLTQLETYTADLEGKKKAAEKEEKELRDHDPNLPDKLTKVKMKKEPLTRQVLQYVNAVNAAVDSRNKLKAAELLKGKKEQNLQVIGETVTNINLMAFGSPELFGNIAMEQLTRLHEDFKEDVKAAQNEMQRIKDFNQDVDVTIETMFQNEVRDEDLQKVREYYADIKAEKEEEDRRRKAEIEQKRKEEEENRQRERERQAEERRERHSEKHHDTIVQ